MRNLNEVAAELVEKRLAIEVIQQTNVAGASAEVLVNLEVMKQKTLRRIDELNAEIKTAPEVS